MRSVPRTCIGAARQRQRNLRSRLSVPPSLSAKRSDLDIYVGSRLGFLRPNPYLLYHSLPHLRQAGVRYRVLDKLDPANLGKRAFLHVDLTTLPEPYSQVADFYDQCINGGALTISRKLYSRASLTAEDEYEGPVIAKSVLNHRGLPELRFAERHGMLVSMNGAGRRALESRLCPPYQIYTGTTEVPSAVWRNPHMMVEKFIPGDLSLPVIKYRQEFFLDLELNTRAEFDSLLCDPDKLRCLEFLDDAPEHIRTTKERLHVDFGSIDYFIRDGEVFVIDVNKTTTITPEWVHEHPPLADYLRRVARRLVQFALQT